MRQELIAAIEAWRERVGTRLVRVLCPIYSEGIGVKPELLGTGVLVRVAEQFMLVSAAHVADKVQKGPHYFGAAEELITLPGVRLSSPMPASGDREDDAVDLAYWPLDPATQTRLSSADALALDQLDVFAVEDVPPTTSYLLLGYPVSRQPRRYVENEWSAETLSFHTQERAAEDYAAIRRDRSSTLLVSYDKEDFFRYGDKRIGPDLHGVSGGALWRLDGPGCTTERPLLAGFATTWRKANPKGVIATRAKTWMLAVARDFPALTRRGVHEFVRRPA